MQFLLVAFDGTDNEALERRMKARPAHLENVARLKKRGEFLLGGAILDDNGKMIGSMIVYEFSERALLDKCLENEPYISHGVWEKIDIRPYRHAHIEN
ncbi:MAG TPA: hypothetical protein DEO60_07100 [Bacteroidales bacterium]|jgi:uncharacterized protein|nr:hypothetical protein [Bacteroidales bacterium]HBZ20875.1 hypothetical protein [Bacteroidales bacterium]